MGRIDDTLYNLLNSYTGEYQTFTKVTEWVDGSPMDDSKCDGVVYRKAGSEYFKLNYDGPLDVKWFGLVGDGITNQATLINNMIAKVSPLGVGVRFTKGNYLIRGADINATPVTITDPIVILCDRDSAFIENQRHTVPLIEITGVNVVIDGMTIQGFETAADFDSTNSTRYGIRATSCDKSIFNNITVHNKSRALGVFNSSDCRIENPVVYGLFIDTPPSVAANFHNSVYVSGGTRNKIINPTAFGVGNCVLVGANSSDGQIIGGSVYVAYDNGVYVSSGLRWSVVSFNAVSPGGTGIKTRGDGNSIIGCKIIDALVGISVTGNGPLNEWGSNGFGNVVKGCYVLDPGADGISLGGQDDGFAYGTVVDGCTVVNAGTVDPTAYGAIRSGGQNHRFINNTFVGCTTEYAVVLGNTSKHLDILNNQFIDCKGGIQSVAIDSCNIVGNHYKDCGTNECIYLDGNCMNNYVDHNTTNDGFLGVYEIRVNQHATLINNNRINLTNTNQYLISSEKNRVDQGNGQVFTVLPPADITQRSRISTFLPVGGNFDTLYYCRRKPDNSFEWIPFAFNYQGSGSPEGVVTGTIGDLYVNTTDDNGGLPKRFVKTTGVNTTTGWRGMSVVPTVRTAPGTAGVGMVPSDGTVLVGNTVTANAQLPNPALVAGRTFIVKKSSNNTTTLSVVPFASETIDGASTYDLSNFNAWAALQSDGTNWVVVGSNREATSTLSGIVSTGTQSFAGAKTFTVATGSTAILCTNANNNLYVPAQAVLTAVTNASYTFGGASTIYMRSGMGGGTTATTAAANSNIAGAVIGKNAFTTAATGTHGVGAGLVVTPPSISGGTATVSVLTSLYIDSPPTGGTSNYSLYANGASFIAGTLSVSGGTTISGLLNATVGVTTTTLLATGTVTTRQATNTAQMITFDNSSLPGVVRPGLYSGNGDPNSVVSALKGSLYIRQDGGAATTLYVKESDAGGTASNTGWVGK